MDWQSGPLLAENGHHSAEFSQAQEAVGFSDPSRYRINSFFTNKIAADIDLGVWHDACPFAGGPAHGFIARGR